jgi:UDP-N-acetyl-D-mannosaminuronate dehydrogenase
MKKFKVGVIGNGFVGEAISFAFSSVADMYVYDTDPLKSLDDLESVHSCDFVFICVPTPMFRMDLKIYHTLKVLLKRPQVSQFIY